MGLWVIYEKFGMNREEYFYFWMQASSFVIYQGIDVIYWDEIMVWEKG
jgi:hypothetical protein